jgi:hypothetical protein
MISKEIDIYIVGDKQFLNSFKADIYNKQTGGIYFRTKTTWLLYLNKGMCIR